MAPGEFFPLTKIVVEIEVHPEIAEGVRGRLRVGLDRAAHQASHQTRKFRRFGKTQGMRRKCCFYAWHFTVWQVERGLLDFPLESIQ